jgi:hypothetical protein
VKKSVARPDDGVHSFFAASAEKIVDSLMDKDALKDLRKHYGPKHRERRFSLPTLLWLGVYAAGHASMKSMGSLLEAACDALTGTQLLPLGAKTLTQSGWTRAKDRLPLDLLRALWARWVTIGRAQAGEVALFGGFHLVALDKKTITVPEALWVDFGSHRGSRGEGPAQAELLAAYDVCLRVPVALTLAKVRTDERRLAFDLLDQLPRPSLILIDSGFYYAALFADVARAGHHFITRMRKGGRPKLLRRFGPDDGLYEIRLTSLPKWLSDREYPQTMRVRIAGVCWPGFRPVRLVTSLVDPQAYSVADLLDLYHRRWHIETFFRELAKDLDFQHWHTRTLHGLWVELLFTMVYVTVVRAHMAEAARAAGMLPGHLSFGRGAQECQRHWCRIPKAPPERLAALRKELIGHLPTLAIDVRPGRSFERNTQKRRAESRKRKLQALKHKRHAA